LSIPLAFVQGIGMVYFINQILGGTVIDTGNITVLLLSAFALTV
jgi:hypothetical protein